MSQLPWHTTATGIKLPGIIYGTAWKKARTADLVVQALLAGFRGIDTAAQPKHYEEALVGEALQRIQHHAIERSALYLQTKFTSLSGHDPARLPYDKNASLDEQVYQSFATSQKNLQTDYVDGLLLHSPLKTHALTLQAWRAMETIHQSGGARLLGISNCYDLTVLQALYADAHVKPTIVQNRFYFDSHYDVELRQWCKEQGLIYQSFWSLTANPHVFASKMVLALAKQYNKTPEQLFFNFLHHMGIVPLSGTCNEQHMRDDLAIFDFTLRAEEITAVDKLLRHDKN